MRHKRNRSGFISGLLQLALLGGVVVLGFLLWGASAYHKSTVKETADAAAKAAADVEKDRYTKDMTTVNTRVVAATDKVNGIIENRVKPYMGRVDTLGEQFVRIDGKVNELAQEMVNDYARDKQRDARYQTYVSNIQTNYDVVSKNLETMTKLDAAKQAELDRLKAGGNTRIRYVSTRQTQSSCSQPSACTPCASRTTTQPAQSTCTCRSHASTTVNCGAVPPPHWPQQQATPQYAPPQYQQPTPQQAPVPQQPSGPQNPHVPHFIPPGPQQPQQPGGYYVNYQRTN